MTAIMRSKLFVPTSRPEFFAKALNSAADAVCFDLEDGVLRAQKDTARQLLHSFLSQPPETKKTLLVRVNAVNSADFARDLEAAMSPAVSIITLPKVQDADEVRAAADALSSIESTRGLPIPIALLPTIESPRGLRLAEAIAGASGRVVGLQLGFADLFESLNIRQNDAQARADVRLQLRFAAGEAGIPCFDSVYTDLADEEGFLQDAMAARDLGFAGKSCIHPRQIEPANRVFSPTAEEIAASKQILDAAHSASQSGQGVGVIDGRMIDEPFVRRAQAVLQVAKALGLLEPGENGSPNE